MVLRSLRITVDYKHNEEAKIQSLRKNGKKDRTWELLLWDGNAAAAPCSRTPRKMQEHLSQEQDKARRPWRRAVSWNGDP